MNSFPNLYFIGLFLYNIYNYLTKVSGKYNMLSA